MRHCTITLTMDTYGHLFPDQQADAVLKLQDMLASGDSDLTQVRRATGTYGTAPEAGEARSAWRSAQDAVVGGSDANARDEKIAGKSTWCPSDDSRKVLPIETLRKSMQADATVCDSSRSGDRTRTSLTGHRILSPVRLPIPPSGQALILHGFLAFLSLLCPVCTTVCTTCCTIRT